ncbi:MAG: MBL fold metallo-hydrolase [Ruminococcus sp.]|nr:MBL fold metallo-hydrolase [Ruminococcus sp.]
MARMYPLFSSSKGNSTFVGTERGGILIDCGVSFKKFSEALEINNIPLDAIKAVFITHEHADHVNGLKMLTKKTGIPVYGQKKTLQNLCAQDKIASCSPVIEITHRPIICADHELSCFNTPHDTVQSCGYKISTYDGKLCAVCTDLGHVSTEVHNALTGCNAVLIESNYDENMLRTGNYPFYLKERILSGTGHLSNDDCAAEVRKLVESGTTHIILGHLSPDNNRPDIARSAVKNKLKGFTVGRDYLIGVAPVESKGGAVIF